jgi:hypothetical protein
VIFAVDTLQSSHLLSGTKHRNERLGVGRGDVVSILDVVSRNDEYVAGRRWSNIAEAVNGIVFIDAHRWNFACKDLAKQAVCWGCHQGLGSPLGNITSWNRTASKPPKKRTGRDGRSLGAKDPTGEFDAVDTKAKLCLAPSAFWTNSDR